MFHKILVALDHSSLSNQVFKQALAKTNNASLMLLHLLSPTAEGYPVPTAPDKYTEELGNLMSLYLHQWEVYHKEGLDFLRSHAVQATSSGISTEYIQGQGSSGKRICELARTCQI
ncbi:hypothetical protein FJSC11DRAFT_0242 [Fischerella thermalis JSC-11]|uniref:UspA domain-containing protein n=2 Tax=Fischerella TaxID=1190 RepID=G6FMZ5_9CYAN|nr:universal stress protein [Fischerella thermalis]EHC19425.1 hypothetical protein FJSC11DRAFT_0242 [Fischerella thermalis JSC-11]